MIITCDITDLADFPARNGAIERKDAIVKAGKGKAFMAELSQVYPEGITQSCLNDLLRYEATWCYKLVGLNDYGVERITAEEVIGTGRIHDEITEAIHNFINTQKRAYGIEYEWEDFDVSDDDFESDIQDWLDDNQCEETDPEELAIKWLEDCGYNMIEEAIR